MQRKVLIVLNPGLSDVSLTGDFTLTLLLLLLLEFGLFTSGLADLSFSLSFFPILGMMFLEGDMSLFSIIIKILKIGSVDLISVSKYYYII
jgi:hypothetical protein